MKKTQLLAALALLPALLAACGKTASGEEGQIPAQGQQPLTSPVDMEYVARLESNPEGGAAL